MNADNMIKRLLKTSCREGGRPHMGSRKVPRTDTTGTCNPLYQKYVLIADVTLYASSTALSFLPPLVES